MHLIWSFHKRIIAILLDLAPPRLIASAARGTLHSSEVFAADRSV
jgi:hypothetical protein